MRNQVHVAARPSSSADVRAPRPVIASHGLMIPASYSSFTALTPSPEVEAEL
jgi:hypothetical protein